MDVILYHQLSQFIFRLPQPICFLCASLLGFIYHSKNMYSPLHLVSHFLFLFLPIRWTISSGLIQIINSACNAMPNFHIFLFLLQQQLTSVELLCIPLQHLPFLHWAFFQILIWHLHFAFPLISFYLTVLTLCIIPSVSQLFPLLLLSIHQILQEMNYFQDILKFFTWNYQWCGFAVLGHSK